jgi:hypothetical protein
MAQVTPGSIAGSQSAIARALTASPSADSTTINDTNFPPASDIVCNGWRSVLVVPRFTGGTAPTITLQILRRVGAAWAAGEKVGPISDGQSVVLDVYGRETYLRVDAIAGAPTATAVHVGGYEPFLWVGPGMR